MNVEISKVGPNESEEWRSVVSWVYTHKPATEDEYPVDSGETRYLARLDGVAAGACTVYDLPVVRGDTDLRCGGIAGVATLPEHRKSGVADKLMRSVLAGMRDEGYAISALYPFRSPYYRRFGYENCGWRWQIKCPQDRLPKFHASLPIRQIFLDQLQSLDAVYVPFIRARSGSPTRTIDDWKHRMGKTTPMVFAIGEPLEAYLWVNLDEFWGDANIGELAWTSKAGFETALSLIGSLCANQSSATWCEPPDSPFIASYMDQGMSATHNRQTMFRVVDLVPALTRFKPHSEGEFVVEIEDEECEWNNGVWAVGYSQDGVEISKGTNAGLRMNVREFSQALMGQPSVADLANYGAIDVWDPSGLKSFAQLLDAKPVVCMEFF